MSIEQPNFEESGEKENSFERQFSEKERLRVAGGVAEVVDIKPEAPKSEVPVLFSPGWGQTLDVYKPALKVLSEQHRRVVSLNHPRIGGMMKEEPEETPGKHSVAELRKVLNLLNVLDQKNIEKTDVIAHSEGAVSAVIAATLHPEKFRNLVLFAPAGLIGKDTFSRLLKGFAEQFKGGRAKTMSEIPSEKGEGLSEIPITETEKEVIAKSATEGLKYFSKNPVRAVKEVMGISETQIHEMLRYLHEQGIGIVVMGGADDTIFPMEKMQKIAKADMLDGFLSVRGAHGPIGEHPELYMTAAEKMLTALEKKKGKKARRE